MLRIALPAAALLVVLAAPASAQAPAQADTGVYLEGYGGWSIPQTVDVSVWDGAPGASPVYLTTADDNPNAAQVRFLVDGAEIADPSTYTRVVYIFDGRDADAVARARADWQTAKEMGHDVSYWQQDEGGRWRKKA